MGRQDEFSETSQQRWEEIKPDSGTVPAFGLCQVTGTTTPEPGRTLRGVAAPTSDGILHRLIVNSGQAVTAPNIGAGTMHFPARVKYNSGSGTPAAGEMWGPKNGQFEIYKDYPGFIILGGIDSGTVWVDRPAITKLIGKAGSAISALSGSTPGSGSVTIWGWVFSSGAPTSALESKSITVTAYNLSGTEVQSGVFLQLAWDGYRWIVDFEDCT